MQVEKISGEQPTFMPSEQSTFMPRATLESMGSNKERV